jgi:hypothetical protein
MTYETIDGGTVPIKAWTRGVPVEDIARKHEGGSYIELAGAED